MGIAKHKTNHRISCENHENHETLGIPFENQENHAIHRISCENKKNHENHRIPFENH